MPHKLKKVITVLTLVFSIAAMAPVPGLSQETSNASVQIKYPDPYPVILDLLHLIGNDRQSLNLYPDNDSRITNAINQWDGLTVSRPAQAQRLQSAYDLCVRAYRRVTSAYGDYKNGNLEPTQDLIVAGDLLQQASNQLQDIPQSDLCATSSGFLVLRPPIVDPPAPMNPAAVKALEYEYGQPSQTKPFQLGAKDQGIYYNPSSSLTSQIPTAGRKNQTGQHFDLSANSSYIDWSQFDAAMRIKIETVNNYVRGLNNIGWNSGIVTFGYTVSRNGGYYSISVFATPERSSGNPNYDMQVRNALQSINSLPPFPVLSQATGVTKYASIGASLTNSFSRTDSDTYIYN